MRYGDCRWVDIDAMDKDGVVAVCPIAALEQHGHHLPLLTDTYLATDVAERVETLDLMRRHGDLLSRDFNRLGHENVSLSFGDPGNPRHSPRGGQRAQDEPQDVPVQTETVGPAQPAASGMDMRL